MKSKKLPNIRQLMMALLVVLSLTIFATTALALSDYARFSRVTLEGFVNPPSVRLHDDFVPTRNGKRDADKNVYVENSGDENNQPLIVRVRLDEFFVLDGETVIGSGTWSEQLENYETCMTGTGSEGWEWSIGGKTTYLPSVREEDDTDVDNVFDADYFDEDGDSQTTGAGVAEYGIHIFDTISVAFNERARVPNEDFNEDDEDTEYPYADSNIKGRKDMDGKFEFLFKDDKSIPGSYTRETPDSSLDAPEEGYFTMEDWSALEEDEQIGSFWVLDEDGWFYWAEPLWGDTATGLLLNHVKYPRNFTTDWEYNINVVLQAATAEDVVDNGKGFGSESAHNLTNDAEGDDNFSSEAQDLVGLIIQEIYGK